MIHTFELSTMVSKETFEEILRCFSFIYSGNNCWSYAGLADKGISFIRLFKISRTKNKKKTVEPSAFYYMVSIAVNPGLMYGTNKEHAHDILSFTPDFVRNIYENILDEIKPLEEFRNEYSIEVMDLFKNRRCDYCFDVITNHELYMELLSRGKRFNSRYYEYTEYDDIKVDAEDEEEVAIDDAMEELEYESSKETLYYKCKSLNINIYRKDKEVKNAASGSFDFMRFELQVKKRKLIALADNDTVKAYYMKNPGRQLQYLASDVVYRDLMHDYLVKIGGRGNYVTKEYAFNVIDTTDRITSKTKRAKVKRLLEVISQYGSVPAVMQLAKDGELKEVGSLKTVKRYIKDVEDMGINPLLIPDDMIDAVEEITFVNADGTKVTTKMLLNLSILFDAYLQHLDERKSEDYVYPDDEIEAIMSQTGYSKS